MNCHAGGTKRYRIMLPKGGWWAPQDTIWADNADEAAEAFVDKIGFNPPNEFAVQSTAQSSNGAFKIFRVKPRKSYDLEVVG